MSYFALVTNKFEEVAYFYEKELGFPIVEHWDRVHGRGRRFDIGDGTRLELIDNTRERTTLLIHEPGDRFHLVIEVKDIDKIRSALSLVTPAPIQVSWG